VIVRARLTSTQKGPYAGIAPTNKPVSWRACNVVELRNGKAIRVRVYADNVSLLQQIGAISIPRATAAGLRSAATSPAKSVRAAVSGDPRRVTVALLEGRGAGLDEQRED
jgi:hypothetical protein